jgi:hydroxymethylbilane synthase
VIRLGTRGSALAMAQARWVAERLPGEVEIVPITTSGDQRRSGVPEFRDKSRFVKEIEQALLDGKIDVAVHSAKDVPTHFARGLLLFAMPERADPRDALCGAESLDDLPEGAVVGTSSVRRHALLMAARPDLDIRNLRGNVDTRLRRLVDGEFDAIVLAQAGLDRLGRGDEGSPLDPSVFVPAAGQGFIAFQIRDADEAGNEATAGLHDDFAAERCWHEERDVVRLLGATCDTPIGVHATLEGDSMRIAAFLGRPDGSHWVRDELAMPMPDAASLIGHHLAERLQHAGAEELLG